MQKTEWFNRKFPIIEDNGVLLPIIERLSGTPARLEEMVHNIQPAILTRKHDDKWSIQEEIGHLSDLEPLWLGRVEDFKNGATELRYADLTNQRTHNANHNAADSKVLLKQFRQQRLLLINAIRNFTDEQLENVAMHPRLKTPMRVIDLAYFVAEHDDHHLATIRALLAK